MSSTWAPPAIARSAAPWPPPDPATRIVDLCAGTSWPPPSVTSVAASTPAAASSPRRPSRRPLVIAVGTTVAALAAFGALFLAI